MKGDFTRWTFNPAKHYHGVLKQQGRVDLDADANEQNAIAAYRVETEADDVIGASGAPIGAAGFMLSVVNNKLQISAGRAYVDGILCENAQAVAMDAQPDYPNFPALTTPGTYIAYLTVWLRHLTSLDDAEMREVALGGPGSPDTCTRAKTVWQVNLAPAPAAQTPIDCTTPIPGLPGTLATLMAQAAPDPAAVTPCAIPATAGYSSLENQLYRVEIHNPGVIGTNPVTYKWSRDNGSVVTAWTGQPTTTTLTVASIGPDSVLGFAAGQWVELTDDTFELNFKPGILVQLTDAQGLTLTIDPATALPPGTINFTTQFTKNPKVRRWDSAGLIAVTPGQYVELENGVQVNFGPGAALTGDYWLIPARTLTANIDWPVDASNHPIALPPAGIRRHYCRLGVVQYTGQTWSVAATCLPTFPPLTALTQGKGIHVTDVQYFSVTSQDIGQTYTELANDSSVPFPNIEFTWGIRVLLDAPIDPVSAQPTTCVLTLELPYPLDVTYVGPSANQGVAPLYGYQPLILPTQVSASSNGTVNAITLTLNAGILRFLIDLLSASYTSRLLARLSLKGDFLWGTASPKLYLDGAAYGLGMTANGSTTIGVNLPSGNGTPGSDFNFWFWLVRPIKVASVTMTPNPVTVGQNANGTVTLDGYAPPGTTVTLLPSSNAGTLVPTTVPITAGQTTGFFSVTNTNVPGTAPSAVLTVTATYAGSSAQGTLTIDQTIRLTGLTFSPNPILDAPNNSTGTVTLSLPAPAGGAVVTLSGGTANLTVPASVTVPAGATSATFTVTGQISANSDVSVPVTAAYNGASITTVLGVNGVPLK